MALRWDPRAKADLSELPAPARRRIRQALQTIAADPSRGVARDDVKLLDIPEHKSWRLATPPWRTSFIRLRDTIVVIHVQHRGQGYGWLDDVE